MDIRIDMMDDVANMGTVVIWTVNDGTLEEIAALESQLSNTSIRSSR